MFSCSAVVVHGSISLGTAGSLVAGSTSRYTPFGSWLTEPTAGLTDRGYTGHMHHNLGSGAEDIGLVYMAARWYAPTLGRFLSADTLIPDPANPQSYNRYSYVQNRVLNATDPTGHKECNTETLDCNKPEPHNQPIPDPSDTANSCENCPTTGGTGDMKGAYEVFMGLEEILQRDLKYSEILGLVIYFEYGTTLWGAEYDVALEATGRQFYEFCGAGGICGNQQLWRFLGAHAAWFSAAYNQSRFDDMLSLLMGESDFSGFSDDLAGARRILNSSEWRSGKVDDHPFIYGNYNGPGIPPNGPTILSRIPAGINQSNFAGSLTVALNRPDLSNPYVVLTPAQYSNLWTLASQSSE